MSVKDFRNSKENRQRKFERINKGEGSSLEPRPRAVQEAEYLSLLTNIYHKRYYMHCVMPKLLKIYDTLL
jgi:hypothetical protein